jgi:small-conductance mechanosensitive channel
MIPDLIDRASSLGGRAVAFATTDRTVDAVRAALIFAVTVVVTRVGSRWVRGVVAHRGDAQRAALAGRLSAWLLLGLGFSAAFEELGFKLHVILGAAGVLSVAIGFAAQTTLSNLISGFFLFGERPFGVGDTIEIDGIAGEVLGVEMLATTLRTADHRYVRIPNETLIKSRLTNQTRFPRRRVELAIPIANDEDFSKIRDVVLAAVKKCPQALREPTPTIFIGGFGETSVTCTVWAWGETNDLQALRASLAEEIHGALGTAKRSGLGR